MEPELFGLLEVEEPLELLEPELLEPELLDPEFDAPLSALRGAGAGAGAGAGSGDGEDFMGPTPVSE